VTFEESDRGALYTWFICSGLCCW